MSITSRPPSSRTASCCSTSGRRGAARAACFAPVYEAASEANPDIVFGSINTEDERDLSGGLQISSIPTLMAFRDGIMVFRQPGALPAPMLDQLIDAVRALDMDDVRRKVAESAEA